MADLRYEMYTEAGNDAVEAMVGEIFAEIRDGTLRRRDLEARIRAGCETVTKAGYPEVYDTEPQCDIADALTRACEAEGWKPVSRWDW